MTERFDAYSPVHRGLRILLTELATDVACARHASGPEAVRLRDAVVRAVGFLAEHGVLEDAHLHPLLRAADPALGDALDREHHELERMHDEVLAKARAFAESSETARHRAGEGLERATLALVEEHFRHMRREETEANRALWAAHDDAALLGAAERVRRAIAPARHLEWLPVLLRGFSHDERVAMLRGVRAAAPKEAVEATFAIAKDVLGASFDEVERALAP